MKILCDRHCGGCVGSGPGSRRRVAAVRVSATSLGVFLHPPSFIFNHSRSSIIEHGHDIIVLGFLRFLLFSSCSRSFAHVCPLQLAISISKTVCSL